MAARWLYRQWATVMMCLARMTRGRWAAYGGVVASENIYKRDLERKFERLLLGSAQVNLIPPEILREIR
jgi:hypothetical protein